MAEHGPIPHFNVHTVSREPLPEMGGDKAILYTSPDRHRVAGSFRESGTHTMTMPFDEFIYIVAGGVNITVKGQDPLELGVGDCCWLYQGDEVTFVMREGFMDVTVLISDEPIDI